MADRGSQGLPEPPRGVTAGPLVGRGMGRSGWTRGAKARWRRRFFFLHALVSIDTIASVLLPATCGCDFVLVSVIRLRVLRAYRGALAARQVRVLTAQCYFWSLHTLQASSVLLSRCVNPRTISTSGCECRSCARRGYASAGTTTQCTLLLVHVDDDDVYYYNC